MNRESWAGAVLVVVGTVGWTLLEALPTAGGLGSICSLLLGWTMVGAAPRAARLRRQWWLLYVIGVVLLGAVLFVAPLMMDHQSRALRAVQSVGIYLSFPPFAVGWAGFSPFGPE